MQRLFGISATQKPVNQDCWHYQDGCVIIDLNQAPELQQPSGAIRLESSVLPERLLIVHGEDDRFRAYRNVCSHMQRRLDPVPGTETIQCCSFSHATYDYQGKVVLGPSENVLKTYPVRLEQERLVVELT